MEDQLNNRPNASTKELASIITQANGPTSSWVSRWLGSLCTCLIPSQKKTKHSKSRFLENKLPDTQKKTLVLDLDETLVHSSFKPTPTCDIKLKITMQGTDYEVHVLVRPGVEDFLKEMSNYYEIVVFTASLGLYANPLLDTLDPEKYISARLFREHCVFKKGNYIKDLSKLGRNLSKTVIVDNSQVSFSLQPHNGIHITSWFNDKTDNQLSLLGNFLKALASVDSVPEVLKEIHKNNLEMVPLSIAEVATPTPKVAEVFPGERGGFNSPVNDPSRSFEFE